MATGLIGAAVGLFGTAISRATDIWEKRSEAKSQLEFGLQNAEIARLELEKEKIRAAAGESISKNDALSRADEANAKAESAIMQASYIHDQELALEDKTSFGAFIRGVVRPILTFGYSAAFIWVVWYATTPEIIDAQAEAIFAAFIEVSVGVTLWWFGLRRGNK